MTGPSAVSIARIDPVLARRSWGRVQRLVAGDGPGDAAENLRCFIAVFGHGDGLRLFEPGTPDELVEDIYMHTLPLAICAALQRAPRAWVTWPRDDEIAARVMTAAVPPRGAVQ